MKKIIVYLLFVVFTASSCENFLEEDPKGRQTPNLLFKDVNGLNMAVTGMYGRFTNVWYIIRNQLHVYVGDDVTAKNYANKARFAEFDRFYYNSLNVELINHWDRLYQCIKACNNIINNAENMDINRTYLEHRLGQAYLFRALTYFQLVRVWGQVPLVTQVEVDYSTPKASIEDIYALIESDLEKAEAYLPEKHLAAPYFQNGINIAPNDAAAKAMRASVWMTQAGWPLKKGTAYYDKAAAKFKEIIDAESQYGYELEPDIATLTKHPEGNYSKEIVFGAFLNPRNGFENPYCEVPEECNGWSDVLPELDFFYNFPEGPRKKAFFLTKVFIGSGNNGVLVDWDSPETWELHPYFRKNIQRTEWSYNFETGAYTAAGIGGHGKTRYLFRYADILLLYAEAIAFGSGSIDQSVVNCVLRVQNRAGVPEDRKVTVGMSREDFQKAVLDERRWETCGMEMSVMGRFYTMQRHELLHLQAQNRIWDPNDPLRETRPVTTIFDTGLNPNLTLSEEYYYFPIPAQELERVTGF